jgi:hypothetical protein
MVESSILVFALPAHNLVAQTGKAHHPKGQENGEHDLPSL